MSDPAVNVFCPTGEGGGVDPTCGEGEGVAQSVNDLGKSLPVDSYGRHRGTKDIGPITVKGYRVGPTEDRSGRGAVFFGGDSDSVKAYESLHEGHGVKEYTVKLKNVLLAGHQSDLTMLFFGKTYGDMYDKMASKMVGKGAHERSAAFDKKYIAEAKKRGYDGIILTSPAPPAKTEIIVIGKALTDVTANAEQSDAMANELVSLVDEVELELGRELTDEEIDALMDRLLEDGPTENVFCATGEGGGIDPTCETGAAGSSSAGAEPKITSTTDTESYLKKLYGGKLTVKDVAAIAGAGPGTDVFIQATQHGATIKVDHPLYSMKRTIQGDMIINNEFKFKQDQRDKTGGGIGTKVFAAQVEAASKAGFKKIVCIAGRSDTMNGYYTWARCGYDATIGGPRANNKPTVPKGTKVSDLMKTAEGRAWWKEHGDTVTMEFDLTEGSQSRRVLAAYIEERKARGTTQNVFCATGEGGGVDPTCGEGGAGAEAPRDIKVRIDSGALAAVDAIGKTVLGGKIGQDAARGLANIVGAPDKSTVSVYQYDKGKLTLSVESLEHGLEMVRVIGIDRDGTRYIENEFIEILDKGKGLGSAIFSDQVKNAAAAGFHEIRAHAAGNGDQLAKVQANVDALNAVGKHDEAQEHSRLAFNGFYTWPQMGYDQAIADIDHINYQTGVRMRDVIAKEYPNAKTILDIMDTPGGAAWWKRNGTDLTDMKFDLRPGSRSQRTLAAYLEKRKQRAKKG